MFGSVCYLVLQTTSLMMRGLLLINSSFPSPHTHLACYYKRLWTNVHQLFGGQISQSLSIYLLTFFDRPISKTNTQFGGEIRGEIVYYSKLVRKSPCFFSKAGRHFVRRPGRCLLYDAIRRVVCTTQHTSHVHIYKKTLHDTAKAMELLSEEEGNKSYDLDVCTSVTYAMMIPLGSDRVKVNTKEIVYTSSRCCGTTTTSKTPIEQIERIRVRKYCIGGCRDVIDIVINIPMAFVAGFLLHNIVAAFYRVPVALGDSYVLTLSLSLSQPNNIKSHTY